MAVTPVSRRAVLAGGSALAASALVPGVADAQDASTLRIGMSLLDLPRMGLTRSRVNSFRTSVDDAAGRYVVHDLNPRGIAPRVQGFVQARNWFKDYTQITLRPTA